MDYPEIFKLDKYQDERGFLSILYDKKIKNKFDFCLHQVNYGFSKKKNTLRGLHYQKDPYDQAKLISCLYGSIYSVAVDIRKNSQTFGQFYGYILSSNYENAMYIPKGFAHGYVTLEDNTLMQWCTDSEFNGKAALCIKYDDPDIINQNGESIVWPGCDYIISDKDKAGKNLNEIE